MASGRRLYELLEEQQEPFMLDLYLHERGYRRKSLFSNNRSSEESKKSSSSCSTGAVKSCSRFARDVCEMLASINEMMKLKGLRRKNGKKATAMEEQGRLSSESDTQDAEERMVQCNPVVSVLDEIKMISNAPLWKLLIHKGSHKSDCSKNQLQEKRQLVFYCISESVKSQVRQKKWYSENKANKLIESDLLTSVQEEESLEEFREEIVKEIGEMVLEEAKQEMADEIIHLYLCKA